MSNERVVESVLQMHALAREIGEQLTSGKVLLLYGELGSGKTTFVQGVAAALGIPEVVASPTFTVVAEYPVVGRGDVTTFVHGDLYRLDEATAVHDPAVRDLLEGIQASGRVTLIEWADRLGAAIPKGAVQLNFLHGELPNQRHVSWQGLP